MTILALIHHGVNLPQVGLGHTVFKGLCIDSRLGRLCTRLLLEWDVLSLFFDRTHGVGEVAETNSLAAAAHFQHFHYKVL